MTEALGCTVFRYVEGPTPIGRLGDGFEGADAPVEMRLEQTSGSRDPA